MPSDRSHYFSLSCRTGNTSVSLHGGPTGFDSLPFALLKSADQSTLFTKAELETITKEIPGETSSSLWKLVSEDEDQGFPGRLTVEIFVGLKGGSEKDQSTNDEDLNLGSIIIVYRAKVEGKNGEKVVTPINLTQVSP